MADIVVRALAGAGGASAGINVSSTVAGFDHAALVAARRSRADAKDWSMWHTTYGAVPLTGVGFANTTGAYPIFNLVAALGAFGTDDGYRLRFGDLGKNMQMLSAAGSTTPLVVTDSFTVPALTLPATYGFPLTEVNDYGVREFGQRRATWHENTQQTLSLRYAAASGETAYEIRALIESTHGAGTFSVSGFDYRYVPGSLSWVQTSAVNYDVSLDIELVTL